jgi:tRNA U38,U39,U40 pseudouridine synthase TruA
MVGKRGPAQINIQTILAARDRSAAAATAPAHGLFLVSVEY